VQLFLRGFALAAEVSESRLRLALGLFRRLDLSADGTQIRGQSFQLVRLLLQAPLFAVQFRDAVHRSVPVNLGEPPELLEQGQRGGKLTFCTQLDFDLFRPAVQATQLKLKAVRLVEQRVDLGLAGRRSPSCRPPGTAAGNRRVRPPRYRARPH
jgi:hypothetical protein